MKLLHDAQSDPGILSHPILLNTGLCALWVSAAYKRCRYKKLHLISYTYLWHNKNHAPQKNCFNCVFSIVKYLLQNIHLCLKNPFISLYSIIYTCVYLFMYRMETVCSVRGEQHVCFNPAAKLPPFHFKKLARKCPKIHWGHFVFLNQARLNHK